MIVVAVQETIQGKHDMVTCLRQMVEADACTIRIQTGMQLAVDKDPVVATDTSECPTDLTAATEC